MTAEWVLGRRVVMLTVDVSVNPRIEREAQALADEGFDVVVLAPEGVPAHEPRLPVERVEVGRSPGRRIRRRLRTAVLAARNVELNGFEHAFAVRARAHRPDVVHVHDLLLLRAGVDVQRAVGAKLVYDMRDWYPEAARATESDRALLRSLERAHIRRADLRITVNPLLAREISRAHGVDVETISLAFDPPPELHDRPHDLLREELGLSRDVRIALYQGWLAPERNLEQLVDAIALVTEPIELVLMGYGGYGDVLLRRAAERGARVHLVPPRPRYEFLRWTASADVGVIPYSARHDLNTRFSSPNKLYEYIAARLPILANGLPYVRDVVERNDFGVVADLEAPERIAEALDAFPYERRREFERTFEARSAEFTWASERPRLVALYERLLA